jgi:hypothetical protein
MMINKNNVLKEDKMNNPLLVKTLSLEILDLARNRENPDFEAIIEEFMNTYNSDQERELDKKYVNIADVILLINNILFGEHSIQDSLGNSYFMNKKFNRALNHIPGSTQGLGLHYSSGNSYLKKTYRKTSRLSKAKKLMSISFIDASCYLEYRFGIIDSFEDFMNFALAGNRSSEYHNYLKNDIEREILTLDDMLGKTSKEILFKLKNNSFYGLIEEEGIICEVWPDSEQKCDEETQDEIDQFYLYMREEAAALDRKMLKMIKQTYKQELKKFLNLSIEGK